MALMHVVLCKDTLGTGRIRTQSLSQTSRRKMNKHILTNNKITADKLSQTGGNSQLPLPN